MTLKHTEETLRTMPLAELRKLYKRHVGDGNNSPNAKFLARRVLAALEEEIKAPSLEKVMEGAGFAKAPDAPPPVVFTGKAPAPGSLEEFAQEVVEGARLDRLTKKPIEELRAIYLETVGRPSNSTNKRYLVWKITQARKGKVSVGPKPERHAAKPGDFKILPLRMEAALVARMDEARVALKLDSRMDLFRVAIADYLHRNGHEQLAQDIEAAG